MIRLGLVAAIAVAGTAAQAQEGFCAEVREVVAAARETPPFSSFPPPYAMQGRRMLGFSVCGTDSLYGYPRITCGGSPTEPGWSDDEELASWIEQCLPQAVRTDAEAVDARGRRLGAGGPPQHVMNEFHNIHLDLTALRFTITRQVHSRFTRISLTAYDRSRLSEPAMAD